MSRKILIAGNWKMNKTAAEGVALVKALKAALPCGGVKRDCVHGPEVLVCPPFLTIPAVVAEVAGTCVKVGAQNIHFKDCGAFTGEVSAAMLKEAGYDLRRILIVPDERTLIEDALICLADEEDMALVLTTGGTGFSQRDVTPEATVRVCERMAMGIPEAMRSACLPLTNRAMLSRAVAGIRGRTLIVNLPGSPKAVRENLKPVLPALAHGLEMLRGVKTECAAIEP